MFYQRIGDAQRRILTETLVAFNGNRTHAAIYLGISRDYLQVLLRKFGIKDAVPPGAPPATYPTAGKSRRGQGIRGA